jgi:putative FmdB family regulatory protein
MPIYEYQCAGCGHQFEATQRITEPRLTDCPSCNQPKLERLISATSFTLKGGGWYKDGYGSASGTTRTEKQVTDKLQKSVDADKAKSAEAATPAATDSSSTSTTSSSTGSGSGGGSGTT